MSKLTVIVFLTGLNFETQQRYHQCYLNLIIKSVSLIVLRRSMIMVLSIPDDDSIIYDNESGTLSSISFAAPPTATVSSH